MRGEEEKEIRQVMMLIQQKRNARLVRALNAMRSEQTQVNAEVQNESLDQNGIISGFAIELQVPTIPSFLGNTFDVPPCFLLS